MRDVWVSQYSLDDDNVPSYHWSMRVHPLVNIPPEPECTTPELVTVSRPGPRRVVVLLTGTVTNLAHVMDTGYTTSYS